jgi:hypothetical protein
VKTQDSDWCSAFFRLYVEFSEDVKIEPSAGCEPAGHHHRTGAPLHPGMAGGGGGSDAAIRVPAPRPAVWRVGLPRRPASPPRSRPSPSLLARTIPTCRSAWSLTATAMQLSYQPQETCPRIVGDASFGGATAPAGLRQGDDDAAVVGGAAEHFLEQVCGCRSCHISRPCSSYSEMDGENSSSLTLHRKNRSKRRDLREGLEEKNGLRSSPLRQIYCHLCTLLLLAVRGKEEK